MINSFDINEINTYYESYIYVILKNNIDIEWETLYQISKYKHYDWRYHTNKKIPSFSKMLHGNLKNYYELYNDMLNNGIYFGLLLRKSDEFIEYSSHKLYSAKMFAKESDTRKFPVIKYNEEFSNSLIGILPINLKNHKMFNNISKYYDIDLDGNMKLKISELNGAYISDNLYICRLYNIRYRKIIPLMADMIHISLWRYDISQNNNLGSKHPIISCNNYYNKNKENFIKYFEEKYGISSIAL